YGFTVSGRTNSKNTGYMRVSVAVFFFQAEDGIRDDLVTGVQTCALPISRERRLAASRALNRIVRRPLDAPVEVVPDSVFDRLPLDITADSAVARALAAREELRQVEAGVHAAEGAGRAATAAFFPSVSVALDYGFQGPDIAFRSSNDFWLASVVVSWNLFNGGRDAARASEAGYEADRARTQRQDLADRIALQVRTAHEAATVARSAITTADARLEAARRTF